MLMEVKLMVNKNKYKVQIIKSCLIQITKPDDSYKTFQLFENQLASILCIDSKSGQPTVIRGRVCHFEYPRTPRSFTNSTNHSCCSNLKNEKKTLAIEAIVMDTSQNYTQSNKTIPITSILEINPIDWKYQDADMVEVSAPINDWYEENKEVSAPSSEFQFRYGN